MADDFADRHVTRWQNHWVEISFDPAVEAATVRLGRVVRYFNHTTQVALAEVGLQSFEYETLHTLMIRDTPGRASPRSLAHDLGVSPAGMTKRLDSLEKAGYLKRTPSVTDRRRVHVEATAVGVTVWRQAMGLRGRAEDALFGTLTGGELSSFNRVLKKLTVAAEAAAGETARSRAEAGHHGLDHPETGPS